LVLQSHPAISIAIEMAAIVLFITAILLARSGRVNTGAVLLLGSLAVAPLAVMVGAGSINIVPFALVFSVLIASLLLPPWQIWLVLIADLVGIALVLAYHNMRGLALDDTDTAVIIVASVMLLMVALVSFLGASETQRERAALQREIAERVRVELELSRAKEAAEAANRAKNTFLANMSHELRTPLTSILGYTDLLIVQTGQQSPQLLSDLTIIRQSGDHLLNLINDILDLSKIEAGKLDVMLATFAIVPLVRDLVNPLHALIERNGNTLVVEYPEPSASMHADPTKVRQILLNLLSNAAKFTELGTITLSVQRELVAGAEWICFRVADTGIGIDAEQLPELFHPFTRLHASLAKYEGTGLGLALSQRLCALMGGTITVESTVGVGTVFTVRLPAVVDPGTADVG
jgi:signal transduction histidine kinase